MATVERDLEGDRDFLCVAPIAGLFRPGVKNWPKNFGWKKLLFNHNRQSRRRRRRRRLLAQREHAAHLSASGRVELQEEGKYALRACRRDWSQQVVQRELAERLAFGRRPDGSPIPVQLRLCKLAVRVCRRAYVVSSRFATRRPI